MNTKNILIVSTRESDVGYAWRMIEELWIAIANRFTDRQVILCFPKVTKTNPALSAAGIRIFEYTFDYSRPLKLANFCIAHNIGVIYLSDNCHMHPLYWLLRRAGVRRIVIHDHAPGSRTAPSFIKRFLKTLAIRAIGADAYIACSDAVLVRLQKVVCAPASRCYLATNGVRHNPFSRRDSTIRSELNLSPTTTIVVSVSRLSKYKRVHDIIEAARFIFCSRPNADLHFVHCGDGPDRNEFHSLISTHGLQDRFTLLGAIPDVYRVLAGCDIAVHASDGEGLCLAVLEFMASGLPIVITNEPTTSACISDGETGLFYRHRECVDLAEKLLSLVDDAERCQTLGVAARLQFEREYSFEQTARATVRVFEALDE